MPTSVGSRSMTYEVKTFSLKSAAPSVAARRAPDLGLQLVQEELDFVCHQSLAPMILRPSSAVMAKGAHASSDDAVGCGANAEGNGSARQSRESFANLKPERLRTRNIRS